MSWLALKIEADNKIAEALSDFLMELGALSVSIEDAHAEMPDEAPIFGEPNMPPAGFWRDNIINALFNSDTAIPSIMQQVQAQFDLPDLRYSVEDVAEQDWVRLTQAQFEPIKILDGLWIVPSWHEIAHPDAINIRLDPGLAFGTGSHPTTFLCLQWLSDTIQSNDSVIDYGCGSGILAIAAKKLGAAKVVGIDIDENAVQASQFNAQENAEAIDFFHAKDFKPEQAADVLVANILSSALIVLAPALSQLCKVGGRIALSGILHEQIDSITHAYQPWFDIRPLATHEGWVLMGGTRKPD